MATSASAQISDSCTSPPLSKMPTTVQSLSRKPMREPTESPANWPAALRPTTTSRTPGSKRRPSTSRASSRMSNAARCTPRNGTLLGWLSPLRGRSTITTSSAEASERPAPSRATPGRAASSVAWSRPTPLESSASEPARSMITRSPRPVLASVWRNPSDIASTDTSTPTTPAMPTTTTSDVPMREGRLRRFMRVMAAIWVSVRIEPGRRSTVSGSADRSRPPCRYGNDADWGGAASLLRRSPTA